MQTHNEGYLDDIHKALLQSRLLVTCDKTSKGHVGQDTPRLRIVLPARQP